MSHWTASPRPGLNWWLADGRFPERLPVDEKMNVLGIPVSELGGLWYPHELEPMLRTIFKCPCGRVCLNEETDSCLCRECESIGYSSCVERWSRCS